MGQKLTLYRMLPVTGLAVMLLAGCASTVRYSATPPSRAPGDAYAAVEKTGEARSGLSVPNVLGLADALALALQANPELAAFSYDVRAAEARLLQAGVLPNPELEIGIDEYNRGGEGFDSSETAVVLGQLFELGGKRQWRRRVAEAEGELAGWDYASKRLDVFTQTAQRFTEALAARERLGLAHAAVDLAEKTHRAVSERVKAGKDAPLQSSKSEAELEMARLDAEAAENALGVARRNLAAMWGAEQAEFEDVQGDLDPVLTEIPTLDALRQSLAQNPRLARWEAELRLRHAALSSEKAARIPDVVGSVSYVQFEEDGTDAFGVGIGMPLPLFDRNQGKISAAAHGLSKAEAERSATEVALAAELAAAHAALRVSHQRVTTLRDKVIPAMAQAFQAAHEGYQQGKFAFLDMLDAQRGLFNAKAALVDAQSDYHTAFTDIQRITGMTIEALMNGKLED